MFTLPTLNYEKYAEINLISSETIEFHVHQHHQAYVNKLNNLIENEESFNNLTLEQIIIESNNEIFNNAAQVWNHSFYWSSINPTNEVMPIPPEFSKEIIENFGSALKFKEEFKSMALSNFGSGWTWLIKNLNTGKLQVMNTNDALPPFKISQKFIPLLTCDVWEHAYYIDYRNKRANYVNNFLEHINWDWANKCLREGKIPELGVKK